MKEDILEQLVDDYLQSRGYFTRHNIKFRPCDTHREFDSKQDSNHSDIDVIGIHPKKTGHDRVVVVSCKSWQCGFKVKQKLAEVTGNKFASGREAWRGFRELVKLKWSEAFIDKVKTVTGSHEFTYMLAVTAIIGDPAVWEKHPPFLRALRNNPIRMIDLPEMLEHLKSVSTTTLASSDIGRVLQLMRAAERAKPCLLDPSEEQES